jgi:[acyl-carrier-protein] S-malonyltransferase
MQQTAHVFPGQGSQRVGMGIDLYSSFKQVKDIYDEADSVLGFPLSKICFEGPEDELRQTINAQPAILVTSIAYLVAKGLWTDYGNGSPVFVAGHSLGEYTALVAAKALAFADAVRLARERGRLMHEAGQRTPGGMVAIIALDESSVQEICKQSGAQVANINSSEQIVISGTHDCLTQAMELAKARQALRVVPLQVSAAFHSHLIQPVVGEMGQVISNVKFNDPVVPVIANTTAQPINTADEIRTELLSQICSCVQWRRSVEYMINTGVSTFIEIGPGSVLTGLIKRIANQVSATSVEQMG